ncbi:MAG: histidine--tRNA ligase [Oscillospiraceae bacterium]|nr:histidine--tRNA ligase [Oscillospiraceae bacterium]
MDFIKTPVKGMRDQLPGDVQLRQRVMGLIRDTYRRYGFTEIETPAMEHIENLSNKQGGENEKLIFKILKRGRDLEKVIESGGADFADTGLRYDLTVPLARYYAANAAQLPSPFKALQIGSVWRADKPQKGRFRQFTQCDIDILGDGSELAEIELIAATSEALSAIFAQAGIRDFTVHVSDRRILSGMARYAGFDEDDFGNVFIILDKLDKIGLDGVRAELEKAGYAPAAVEKCVSIFAEDAAGKGPADFCAFLDETCLDPAVPQGLERILACVRAMNRPGVSVVFDPTLVRGMGYYTGTIFECTIDGYGFAIAGGGRYDKMVGKYSGTDVPACGFSIGFERIITILQDHADAIDSEKEPKVALLAEKGVDNERLAALFHRAQTLRDEGKTVTVQTMKKNIRRQIELLEAEGYTEIEKVYKN